jgi:SAM-dependent methyltransferase
MLAIETALKNIVLTESAEERSYFNQHRYRYLKTLQNIPKAFIQGKIVVDLGTVPGHLLQAFKLLGATEAVGVDYNPERFDFKQRMEQLGLVVKKADIETQPLPLPNNSADLVTFTEVIEHFQKSPEHVLREIYRILKPGGALAITTPNINNLANRIRILLGKNIYPSEKETGPLEQQQHHHEYSLSELLNLLRSQGFAIEKYSFIAGTEMALLQDAMPNEFPRLLGKLYALVPLLIPPLRSYIFLLAQKPSLPQ